MSRATDPGRASLLRYLYDCLSAERRARELLRLRQARVEAATRQIQEWDRQGVPTADEMFAGARMAKRRNSVKRRTR